MRTHTCIHVPEVLWAWEWAGGWAEQVRGLSPEFASRWPELRSVPFFLAVGDGAAGNASPCALTPCPVPLVRYSLRSSSIPCALNQNRALPLGLGAANIGAGVGDSKSICVTVGTSAAARTVIHTSGDHAPLLSPGLWVRPSP
jgi:hypothetical protein